jgi:hypothetical protein
MLDQLMATLPRELKVLLYMPQASGENIFPEFEKIFRFCKTCRFFFFKRCTGHFLQLPKNLFKKVLSNFLSVHLYLFLTYSYLPTYLLTYLRTYVPTYLPTYLPTNLPTYLPTYTSIIL